VSDMDPEPDVRNESAGADANWMRRALDLAEKGRGSAAPNPVVGAVVVRDGTLVGEGFHRGPRTPHAEVEALAQAGELARDATLYTTLEPCAHFGRTPPCTRAIVDAGVARVVSALRDPHAIVDGKGFARLSAAGIGLSEGVLGDEAARQLRAYTKHVTTGLPFVILKMAATLDGKIAARDGTSRWITGEAARADAHGLRAASGAVLVGSGTALADDPSLTVRDATRPERPPLRVLVDPRGRVDERRRLFDGSAPTLVATTDRSSEERREAWRRAGADVLVLGAASGGLSLPELLEHLGKRDVQQLLLEGGPTLAWSAVEADLVDRIVLYLAPRLLGGAEAPSILAGSGFAPLERAAQLRITDVRLIGNDVRVEADVHRDR
jgi:diaminohydroxyphosphoribosylaminopyrimidine deaminase / 5-amino-6-(5-phosphoribosylamino)uracil reductase